jgi:hypothetical protein
MTGAGFPGSDDPRRIPWAGFPEPDDQRPIFPRMPPAADERFFLPLP